MKDVLRLILEQGTALSVEEIILHIISSGLIGIAIYISYWYTHIGKEVRKFMVY